MLNRRQFVAGAAATAACALCPGSIGLAAPKNAGPVDVGTVEDYAKAGVTTTWARSHRFFVIRVGDKLFASSSRCSHEGERLTPKGDELYCREHRSAFTIEGRVKYGKPRRDLNHYGIALNDEGRIIVDTSKRFKSKNWDDAGASIKL